MGQNLTKSGVVIWGSTEHGQIGRNGEEVLSGPQLVDSLRQFSRISWVGCGSDYSAAVTDKGELLLWGIGSSGRLGLCDGEEDSPLPRIVPSLKNVVYVSCSDRHTAAVTDQGELYTWGCGKNGKLGHGLMELSVSNNFVSEPMRVKSLIDESVTQVSCGSYHTGCLTSGKKAYTWGLGLQGRLGHGDTSDVFSPKLIETLAGLSIKEISCGGHHTGVLMGDGKVYMFGGGAFGKLGFGSKEDILIPKLLNSSLFGNLIVSKISLGYQHTAVATRCGKVFTWGQGGRLGHVYNSPEPDFLVPKKLSSLEEVFIVDISCGYSQTVALSDVGDIYAWGLTKNLGHGDPESHPNKPTKHPILHNKNIVQIDCSRSHSIALSDVDKLANKIAEKSKLTSNPSSSNDKSSELEELVTRKILYELRDKVSHVDNKEKIEFLLSELKRSEEQNTVLINLLDVSVRKLELLRKENEELKRRIAYLEDDKLR
ncbi:uvb-resistance protein uvr8 [Cryptosporidium ryanae]|uniref:uvb-resistance protein uvr8 n=1 Tax=Cryptosporidium ryanae TaxID=515981 RepID=UPI00351A48F7|nr:uvb-resistance protein uvr8 [Cryptosporidium ryanae]